MSKHLFALPCGLLLAVPISLLQAAPRALQPAVAEHAFATVSNIATAAASGANVVYTPGIGPFGRDGLPDSDEWTEQRQILADGIQDGRRHGVELVLGEVSATLFARRAGFDTGWPLELRTQLRSLPAAWRQQDSEGRPLAGPAGSRFDAACLNNPDWRTYQRYLVHSQLKAGCDGIFFEDLAVQAQGCYCPWCMRRFLEFLHQEDKRPFQKSSLNILHVETETFPLAATRELAVSRTNDFRRFRCTIAPDFLADLRAYARSIRPTALVSANNGLRRPDQLFAQCRVEGRSIAELSRGEDYVVVEDPSSLPRVLPGGEIMEYAPTYKQLKALSRGKLVVASLLAASRGGTPPDLIRLAMAEAVACDASYLAWPLWPQSDRVQAAAVVRAQVDLMRRNDGLLNGAEPRRDAVLFLPFRQWLQTDRCAASSLASALTRAQVQYEVTSEDGFLTGIEARVLTRKWRLWGGDKAPGLRGTKVLVTESLSSFNPDELKMVERFINDGGKVITGESPDWLPEVQRAIGTPSITVAGPPTVRAFVKDTREQTVIHLLNLDVQRISETEAKISPALRLRLTCRVPFETVRSVEVQTADPGTTWDKVPFEMRAADGSHVVEFGIPRLEVAALVVIRR